jgi:hypothetical protein
MELIENTLGGFLEKWAFETPDKDSWYLPTEVYVLLTVSLINELILLAKRLAIYRNWERRPCRYLGNQRT